MAENKNRPSTDFMEVVKDISASMRTVLVDWLVEVKLYQINRRELFNSHALYHALSRDNLFLSDQISISGAHPAMN